MKQKNTAPAFQKNQRVELEITGLTAEGAGVGRAQEGGMAVFVPGVIPGERVLAHIVKPAKTFAWEKPWRSCAPPRTGCLRTALMQAPAAGAFTGTWPIPGAGRQAAEGAGRPVPDCGFVDFSVDAIVGAQAPDRYRNKAQFPIGKGPDGKTVLGFYAPRSHRIIPCEDCLLQPESFSRAAAAFREWADAYGESIYNEKEHSGKLRHLYLRQAASDGGVMACVVANGRSLGQEEALIETMRRRVPELKSLLLNCNQGGHQCGAGERDPGCSGGKKPFPIPCAALLSPFPLCLFTR